MNRPIKMLSVLLNIYVYSLKAAMTVIETEIKSCPNLVLLTTMLGLLNIKGTSFAELFAMFPDVDTFCRK